MLRAAIWIAGVVLAAFPIPAAVFYVSPSGDDAATGARTAPWRTLARAARAAGPGDTVYLRQGVYHERLHLRRSSGKPGAPITFAAAPGEHPVIDGAGVDVPQYQGLIELEYASYVRLLGIEVRNSAHLGVASTGGEHLTLRGLRIHHCGTSGIMLVAAKHRADTVVSRCEVFDCINGGIVLWQNPGGYFTIRANSVHHVRGVDNYDAIQICDTPYVAVLGNIVHDNAPPTGKPEGDQIDAGGTNALVSPSHHLIYEGNLVYGRGGEVKMNNEPLYSIIRRNVILDTGFTFYEGPTKIAVCHNTVLNPVHAVQFWGDGNDEDFGGARIANNLFVNARSYAVHLGHGTNPFPPSLRLYGNLYRFAPDQPRGFCVNSPGLDATFPAGTAGLAEFARRTRQESCPRVTTQPLQALFADPANHDFHLRPGSDAIDAGLPLTRVRQVRSPTEFIVECSWFFQDGWNGLLKPDVIRVAKHVVRIAAIDYAAHRITVSAPVPVRANDPVSLPFSGLAPDAGAYEFIGKRTGRPRTERSPAGSDRPGASR